MGAVGGGCVVERGEGRKGRGDVLRRGRRDEVG